MEKDKDLYVGIFENMNGLILKSRGGTKNSKNQRNPDYSLLLRYILEKFKVKKIKNIQIFVAARNNYYKTLEDRKIIINDQDTFDFEGVDLEVFIKKLNSAIRKSGQKEGTKGGNTTKRLFFYQKNNQDISLQENETQNVKTSFNKTEFLNIMKKFKYGFNIKPKNKDEVELLQSELLSFVKNHFVDYKWDTEYKLDENRKDSFDVYGTDGKHHIIIELDPHRADSIAKKFVSRIAMTASLNLTYVSFLYKGTDRMSINEAKKYCSDCEIILEMLNNDEIDTKKDFIGYYHFDIIK